MDTATTDGRPYPGKTDDSSAHHYLQYHTGNNYGYLAMMAWNEVKNGINQAGLSLQNSTCSNMGSSTYPDHTALKIKILGQLDSVSGQ